MIMNSNQGSDPDMKKGNGESKKKSAGSGRASKMGM